MDRINSKESGVTLVELIIVIVIVGICFVSVMGLFVNAININTENEIKTVATSLAHGKMEEILQTKDYSDFDEPSGGGVFDSGAFDPPFEDYNYEIKWNYVESSNLNSPVAGPTEYKSVEVIVDYEKYDLEEEIKMRTLFSYYQE